jgi:hypothetical protein
MNNKRKMKKKKRGQQPILFDHLYKAGYKPGMVHVYNPSTGEAEAGGLRVPGKSVLKTKQGRSSTQS